MRVGLIISQKERGIPGRYPRQVMDSMIDKIGKRARDGVESYVDEAARMWVLLVQNTAWYAGPAPEKTLIQRRISHKKIKLGWFNFPGDAYGRFMARFPMYKRAVTELFFGFVAHTMSKGTPPMSAGTVQGIGSPKQSLGSGPMSRRRKKKK